MNINTKKTSRIGFTIPDGSPQEQIRMIDELKGFLLSTAKLTGEEVDVTPLDEAKKKLELSHPPQSRKGEE